MNKNSAKKKKKASVYGKIHFRFSESLLIAILTACMTFSKQLPVKNESVDPVTVPTTVSDPTGVTIPVTATDFNSIPAAPYDDDVSGTFIDANGKVYQCIVASDGTLHVLLD